MWKKGGPRLKSTSRFLLAFRIYCFSVPCCSTVLPVSRALSPPLEICRSCLSLYRARSLSVAQSDTKQTTIQLTRMCKSLSLFLLPQPRPTFLRAFQEKIRPPHYVCARGDNFYDDRVSEGKWAENPDKEHLRRFYTHLAVCHSVMAKLKVFERQREIRRETRARETECAREREGGRPRQRSECEADRERERERKQEGVGRG